MNRALRSIVFVFAAAIALTACPGTEPETGTDAQTARPDGSQQPSSDGGHSSAPDASTPAEDGSVVASSDAAQQPGADAGQTVEPDASALPEDASVEPGRDASSQSPADAATPLTTDGGQPVLRVESRIGSGVDAVSSYLINASPAAWNIFSGDHVPLGRHFDADHVSYHTALRFPSVNVPAGATITGAKVSFYPTNEVDSSNNLYINLYAEKSPNSAPFDPTNYDSGRPDQRAKTTAKYEQWLVRCNDSCTDLTEYDCPQRKLDCWDRTVAFTCPKDLKAMVQEVVNLPGWAAGNALTIFLINGVPIQETGAKYQSSRSIVGYDTTKGVEYAPKLVVEYAQ